MKVVFIKCHVIILQVLCSSWRGDVISWQSAFTLIIPNGQMAAVSLPFVGELNKFVIYPAS